MKHTDWLRLQTEGEKLCALLRQHHYQGFKQPHRLSWKINNIIFVHRRDKGGQFISYRKLKLWIESIIALI